MKEGFKFELWIDSEGVDVDSLQDQLFLACYDYYRNLLGYSYTTAEVARRMGIKRTRLQMWMKSKNIHHKEKTELMEARKRIEQLEELLKEKSK